MENDFSKQTAEINETIKALKRKHMSGYFVNGKEELFTQLCEFIPDKTTVGCGDSVTLEELGVFEYLRKREIRFLDKFEPSLTKKEKKEIYRKNFMADTFITGTNAVTKAGMLFNIDGNGSRVAPMIYGPDQVIVVVGTNKIVKDTEEAVKRTRQVAAPLDARRLGKSTPCTVLNRCIDCGHRERICNDFVLITGQFDEERIKVIFVNGEFGY
ncbi:lactate utilization protein [Clostridium sp. HBUAS56010]|uniref:lactate utilization protein n=1 Tax=Clostridium sp. HBUAS56010 TaxID=2571127 RepID=UPI001178422D|nr:lactate utilization protein [Clostridium sp. HBUAS56010]